MPDSAGKAFDRSVPASKTLLKELLRQRHLKYETFCRDYERTAAQITADEVPPSRAQFYRWISGQLKGGTPYPDACRVLESMFIPWTVAELFAPYQPYDPAAVPAWARDSIASIARDHPETLPTHLYKVAEIEATRRYSAEHPAPPPPVPDNPRDYLHLCAIAAWQAITHHRPAPDMDPTFLFQDMVDVFGTSNGGTSPVERLIDDWYELADKCGINVNDEDGELRPEVDQAITSTVTASVWFGITTGYLTLTGTYSTPHRLRPYFQRADVGSRGGGTR